MRVDGVESETGNHRPRQRRTYPSQRAARNAAAQAIEGGRERVARELIGDLVQQWGDSRTDVSPNQRQQHRWAAGHIQRGIGAIAVERLGRDDINTWLGQLAAEGDLSRRSIQIIRMTARAALAAAVDSGDLRRNVAARVPMPRDVARPARAKEIDAWDADQLAVLLDTVRDHGWRWTVAGTGARIPHALHGSSHDARGSDLCPELVVATSPGRHRLLALDRPRRMASFEPPSGGRRTLRGFGGGSFNRSEVG